jgi:4-amino-4-deoxy-L-arabinose transferase-like glycosyltransferase
MASQGDGTLYAVECALLSAAVVAFVLSRLFARLRRHRPGFDLAAPLLVAGGVRLVAAAVLSSASSLSELRGPAERGFATAASNLADGGSLLQWANVAAGDFHVAFFAAQFKVLQTDIAFSVRIVQIGLAVAGIMFLAAAAHDLAGRRAGVVVAWVAALEPASVFFSSLLHKEPPMMLAGGLVAFGAVRMWQRRDLTAGLLLVAGTGLGLATRSYAGAALGAGALLVTMHAALSSRPPLGRRAPRLAAVTVVVGLAAIAGAVLKSDKVLEVLQRSQAANTTDASNLRLDPVDFSSWPAVAVNAPQRVVDLLVRPFPWQRENRSQQLGALGTLIAWTLMLLVIVGAATNWADARRRAPPLLYPLVFLLLAYAVSVGNAGTGFRYRTHLIFFAIALATVLWADRLRVPAPVRAAWERLREHVRDRTLPPALAGARLPLLLIGLATLARLVYGLGSNDPLSGPDAPTYGPAAADFAEHGLLSGDVTGMPYYPSGYPILVSLVYMVAGDHAKVAMVIQILLLAVGSWAAYTLIRREIGKGVALITLVLLCASPALLAASSQLMYEPLMLVALAGGLDLISRGVRAERWRRLWLVGAGALLLGVGCTLQPKALLGVLFVPLWVFFRTRGERAGPRLVATVACATALALPLLGMAIRNQVAHDEFGLSASLGTTWIIGLERAGDPPRCELHESEFSIARDREFTDCLVSWSLRHPLAVAALVPENVFDFFRPHVGPRAYRDTWFHAFDARRVLPASVRDSQAFRRSDEVATAIWTVAIMLLLALGIWLVLRDRRRRAGALLLLIPLAGFLVVSVFTVGDPRYRLPVAPFYLAFQIVAALWLAERVWAWSAGRLRDRPAKLRSEPVLERGPGVVAEQRPGP